MSERERASALRRMAGNIAAGLVRQPVFRVPLSMDGTVEYDGAVSSIVTTAVDIAEDIYAEVENREKKRGETA